jgi:hypothetical protein
LWYSTAKVAARWLAFDLVAKSTPDGYTLLVASTAISMNAAVNRNLHMT